MSEPVKQVVAEKKLTRKDYQSSNEPRWCAGCGDYAIFNALTSVFAEKRIPNEEIAIISGIGCSSRFPYYAETYGFHTLHGRAPTVALGLRLANPDLNIWVITGDGDALSIGGNHFMHMMRRNPNMKVLIFNNRIYGLTKGQASPTTVYGSHTKSTPFGSIDIPINPVALALAMGATFVARCIDRDMKGLKEVMSAAQDHKGVAIIEVYQNCVIFNNGAFTDVADPKLKEDASILLKHGMPILFGANQEFGVRTSSGHAEVIRIKDDRSNLHEVAVHNIYNPDPSIAFMLAQMESPLEPVPFGIFRQVSKPTYEEFAYNQERKAKKMFGSPDIMHLLHDGDTWEVGEDGKTVRKTETEK